MPAPAPLELCLPGTIPYTLAWHWQKQRLASMQASDRADGLLLLSHPPVYTLGQGATPDFHKFDPTVAGYEVHRVERGGGSYLSRSRTVGGLSPAESAATPSGFALVHAPAGASSHRYTGSI